MTKVPLGTSALVVGATGAVGRHIFSLLLGSKDFTKVAEYGRRVTPQTELASQVPPNKLQQKTIDFEKIAEEGLQDGRFDVVVLTWVEHVQPHSDQLLCHRSTECCVRMGTTRAAAGGMENFVKIDREYVLATAAAARVPGVKQRLLYVSVSSSIPLKQSSTAVHDSTSSRRLAQIQVPSFPTPGVSRLTL
jgi:oxidoreductase